MEAIFRVDGSNVVTSPFAAGPWDPSMQHGSPPAALVVWAAERIPTAVPMRVARVTVDLMRPVPVAPLTIESEVLREGRKIQLCAVRLLAGGVVVVGATVLKIKVQTQRVAARGGDPPGRTSGAGSIAGRARGFFVQPVRDRNVAPRRPRPFRLARSRRDLVSRRPADRGGLAGHAGDAGNGGGGFLQRHRVGAGFSRMDLSQRRSHREFFARAGRRLDPARCRSPGSVRTARGSPWHGSPMSAAISAAPSRALVIEKR